MEGLQVNDTGIYECRIQMPGEDSIMLLNILLHISAEGTLSQPNSSIGVTPRTTSSTTFAMAASISTVVLVLAVFLMGILGLKWKQRRNEGPWKYFTWNIFRRDIISPAPTREDDFAIYGCGPQVPGRSSVSELQLAVKRHPLKSGEGSVNETLSGLSKYCICPDYLLGRWKIVLSGGKASHSQA
ncbi:hypothetical protein Y1Q_0003364 [Alligator mississippiensis]|uniref:Uncharacterized protein n=1 Tax=Alligator mississippiensis TaxID=8496 RepID=A0A151MB27_ALLMI|nr:hypothetical protein Y1Q_0003364 [Alligator mississippiensis]